MDKNGCFRAVRAGIAIYCSMLGISDQNIAGVGMWKTGQRRDALHASYLDKSPLSHLSAAAAIAGTWYGLRWWWWVGGCMRASTHASNLSLPSTLTRTGWGKMYQDSYNLPRSTVEFPMQWPFILFGTDFEAAYMTFCSVSST